MPLDLAALRLTHFGYKAVNHVPIHIARQENKRDNSPVPDSHTVSLLKHRERNRQRLI